MKNEPNKQDFFNLINKIWKTDSFFKGDGCIKVQQIEAIEEHGAFLSLIPEEKPLWQNIDIDPKNNHTQIACCLLDFIRDINLGRENYKFTMLELTSKEKKAIERDLALAEKYLLSIKDSPSKELVSLVEQNIQDYKNFLKHKWIQEGIIQHIDFPTISTNKEEYQPPPKKPNKKAIKDWLGQLVKDYDEIKGYSKELKKLVDTL